MIRNDQKPAGAKGIFDSSHSKESQGWKEKVLTAEEEMRYLIGRLLSAQDAERQSTAGELHDNFNQRAAILSIGLQQLYDEMPGRESPLHAQIQSLQAEAQQLASEIHRLYYRIYPSRLDYLDLAAVLKEFCGKVSKCESLTIEFRHRGFPASLSTDVKLCIFRILQESLQNVIKHSGARCAIVDLEKTDQTVRLTVSDEGCGFDEKIVRNRGGLGLISMRERLRLLGGEISIRSQALRGTQIDASVPLTM